MKRCILSVVAAFAALAWASEPAPTREWVRRYVGQAVSNSTGSVVADTQIAESNGVVTISAGNGEYALTAVYERPSVLAIVASDCISGLAIATNGMKWAQISPAAYSNSYGVITATATNYVYQGFSTRAINGPPAFYNGTNRLFTIGFTIITRSAADAL